MAIGSFTIIAGLMHLLPPAIELGEKVVVLAESQTFSGQVLLVAVPLGCLPLHN